MSNGQVAAETSQGSLLARVVALALAAGVMLLLIEWASGQEAGAEPDPPAAAEEAAPTPVAVLSTELTGTIADVDGTPWAGVPVTLSAADGTVVATTSTGEDGSYTLAAVPEGAYLLEVGTPGLAAPIETSEQAKTETLNVVMPALLTAPTPAGTPEELQPEPAVGVAVTDKKTVTLLAAPLTYPEEVAIAPEAAAEKGPPDNGHPGQGGGPPPGVGGGRPPAPPGLPPDKPLPPPFTSPDEP